MHDFLGRAIEATVFILMLVVGMDCTVQGFRRSTSRPWLIGATTAIQFIATPALVLAVVWLLDTPPALAAGLLLFAVCPSGSISNGYTFLARGNSPLSVTLTTVSCLVALLATPLALSAATSLAGTAVDDSVALPPLPLLKQLLLSMALPVAIGIALRTGIPGTTEGLLTVGRVICALLIPLTVILIILTDPAAIWTQIQALWLPALVITTTLLLLGRGLAAGFRLRGPDCTTLIFELPCRNLAIAALIGLSVLHRPQLVYMATAFFIVEAVILLLVAGMFSRRPQPRALPEHGHPCP